MEHHKEREKIETILDDLGFDINQQMLNQLSDYCELLKIWAKKISLISKNDQNYLIQRHLIPSFWISETVLNENPVNIVDLGSGAGFPGLVIKILNPHLDVVLIDSMRKKTLFLKEITGELNISVEIITDRIEKFAKASIKKFDISVNRAVNRLNKTWPWSRDLLSDEGAMFAMKGGDYQEEINELAELNVNCEVIKPAKRWIKLSSDLADKTIIKVKANERK